MLSRGLATWPGRVCATGMISAAAIAVWVLPLMGATIMVGPDDDFQAALDRARGGDVIVLQAGATYIGNFVLPARDDERPIFIRTSTEERRLPSSTGRIGPEHADLLPKLKSPNTQPVLRTRPGANGWRFLGIEFVGNGQGDIVTLGDGGNTAQRDASTLPRDLVFDRILMRGDPVRGQKRGIALNSGATTIRNSYIADIKAFGQESQAIAGWNGTGPYLIENNFLEAAGISILFGGADPAIPNLVPSDIIVRRNHMTKNVDWRGSRWTVKNIFELKNARNVLIEGNLMENCWTAAQPGYAVLFTTRNSNKRATWATIENVMFRNNIVRHSAGGVNILGYDNTAPSQTADGITIQNNLFDDINHRAWGGNGLFLQIGNAPSNVTVDHNTVINTGNIITAYGGSGGRSKEIPGFRFTNNLTKHNAYGIFGNGVGTGTRAIDVYFPDGVFRGNVMAGGPASRYPSGNFFPSVQQFMADFVDADKGDYRLSPRSSYRRAASDGADIGAVIDVLNRFLAGPDQ